MNRLRESVALQERLAADYPAVTDYRNGLAFALTALGRACTAPAVLARRTGRCGGPRRYERRSRT